MLVEQTNTVVDPDRSVGPSHRTVTGSHLDNDAPWAPSPLILCCSDPSTHRVGLSIGAPYGAVTSVFARV